MRIKLAAFLSIFVILLFCSCSKNYFSGIVQTPVYAYPVDDDKIIPDTLWPNEIVFYTAVNSAGYRQINYAGKTYYARFSSLAYEQKVTNIHFVKPVSKKVYYASGEFKTRVCGYSYGTPKAVYKIPDNRYIPATTTTTTTKSSSSTSQSNSTPSSGKTVQVKGYYRSNGTYVQPHTRSAPTRSSGRRG